MRAIRGDDVREWIGARVGGGMRLGFATDSIQSRRRETSAAGSFKLDSIHKYVE